MHIYLKTSSRYFFIPLLSVCLSFFIFCCCCWCCFLHTILCCVFKNLSLPFSLMYIFSFYRVSVWLLRLCCTFKAAERRKNDALDVCILCDEPCFDINQCTKHYIVSAVVYAWEMLIYSFFRFLSLSLSLFFYYSLADKRVSDWTRKCEYDALIYAMDVFQKICFVHNINDTHTHTQAHKFKRRPASSSSTVTKKICCCWWCFESGGRYYKKKSSHILHHASTNSRFVIKKRISKQ